MYCSCRPLTALTTAVLQLYRKGGRDVSYSSCAVGSQQKTPPPPLFALPVFLFRARHALSPRPFSTRYSHMKGPDELKNLVRSNPAYSTRMSVNSCTGFVSSPANSPRNCFPTNIKKVVHERRRILFRLCARSPLSSHSPTSILLFTRLVRTRTYGSITKHLPALPLDAYYTPSPVAAQRAIEA